MKPSQVFSLSEADAVRAWHFSASEKLHDGRAIPSAGEWITYHGSLVLCNYGLRACREPFDALQYASSDQFLHMFECAGDVVEGADILVCSRLRVVASMDATKMLRYYSRMQALSVVHLWDAPQIVLDYLRTGDEYIRVASRAASSAEACVHATTYAAAQAALAATYAAAQHFTPATAWTAALAATHAGAARAAARKDFNELVYDRFREWPASPERR